MGDLQQAIKALNEAPKTNIKGKQYTQVATRVEVFRRHFGLEYGLMTEVLPSPDDNLVRVRATITHCEGDVVATGMAEEDRRNGNINKTSALENCETSAIGRALAAFGLHGGEYATANEVEVAQAQQKEQEEPRNAPDRSTDSTGKWNKTAVKRAMVEFGRQLDNCGDHDEYLSLVAAHQELFNACIELVPLWWYGNPKEPEATGYKERIDQKGEQLVKAAREKAEYEPAQ